MLLLATNTSGVTPRQRGRGAEPPTPPPSPVPAPPRMLANSSAAPFGLRRVRLLHRAEAPDRQRQFRQRHGRVACCGPGRPAPRACRPRTPAISARSIRRSALYPKGSRGVPRSTFSRASQGQSRPTHPEGALFRPPVRPGPAEQRRRKVEGQLQIALELGFGLLARRRQEPRHLVFVLVGQKLVIALRHGFRSAGSAARSTSLR
jgi:hypothetical protein